MPPLLPGQMVVWCDWSLVWPSARLRVWDSRMQKTHSIAQRYILGSALGLRHAWMNTFRVPPQPDQIATAHTTAASSSCGSSSGCWSDHHHRHHHHPKDRTIDWVMNTERNSNGGNTKSLYLAPTKPHIYIYTCELGLECLCMRMRVLRYKEEYNWGFGYLAMQQIPLNGDRTNGHYQTTITVIMISYQRY